MDQYKERRQTILSRMPDNAMVVVTGAVRQHQSADQHYPFQQTGDFYYLTGWTEPDGVLIMIKKSGTRSILFHTGENAYDQRWHGRNISHGDAIQIYGFSQAEPREKFDKWLAEHRSEFEHVHIYVTQVNTRYQSANAQSSDIEIKTWLTEMRLIKSEQELAHIRHACSITAQAHQLTIETAAQSVFKNEREVAATFQYHTMMLGADCLAYDTIAASGDNACILHYTDNNEDIKAGSCILLDAGASCGSYAADVTRTWPISRQFSREQAIVYDIVFEAHQSCFAMLKSGVKMSDIQKLSQRILVDGLITHGIVEKGCDSEAVFKAFYGHGVGHSLGLDVHDPSPPRGAFELCENVVVTLEPGLYLTNHELLKDKRFLGIGVRLEDNCLVQTSGALNLTKAAPIKRSEIELLMRKQ